MEWKKKAIEYENAYKAIKQKLQGTAVYSLRHSAY